VRSRACSRTPPPTRRPVSAAAEGAPHEPVGFSAMERYVRLRDLLIGVEGLALLRHLYDGSVDDADRRIAEVRRLLDDDAFSSGEPMREADPRTGYRSWSPHYDKPGNPIVALEEPAVWSLLGALTPGDSLDAACGTGRHARHLADLGHRVVGVDLTLEMLTLARDNVPEATFIEPTCGASPLRTNALISSSVAWRWPMWPTRRSRSLISPESYDQGDG
jgi:hypothetical protein